MPVYEIMWEIALTSNNGEPLNMPGALWLASMYPLPKDSDKRISLGMDASVEEESVNIFTSYEGFHGDGETEGMINMSQRVSADDEQAAWEYLVLGNSFASDAGVAKLINDTTIDIELSDLIIDNVDLLEEVQRMRPGTYLQPQYLKDKGTYAPPQDVPVRSELCRKQPRIEPETQLWKKKPFQHPAL